MFTSVHDPSPRVVTEFLSLRNAYLWSTQWSTQGPLRGTKQPANLSAFAQADGKWSTQVKPAVLSTVKRRWSAQALPLASRVPPLPRRFHHVSPKLPQCPSIASARGRPQRVRRDDKPSACYRTRQRHAPEACHRAPCASTSAGSLNPDKSIPPLFMASSAFMATARNRLSCSQPFVRALVSITICPSCFKSRNCL